MKRNVAILLAEGFEEGEVVVVADILRRLYVPVETLACAQDGLEVLSYHDMAIRADSRLTARSEETYGVVMMPGGPRGARALGADAPTVDFVRRHLEAGSLICPFCSAGAHVMAANGLLGRRRYTCSGDNHLQYADGEYVDAKLVRDGNILTGKGLGVAFEYAFAIATELGLGKEATEHAAHIYFDSWPIPIAE